MDRIKTVISSTLEMLKIGNLFIVPLVLLFSYIDSVPIHWDYIIYINIYAALTSITFGYMDNVKLENKIIAFILIITGLTSFTTGKIGYHANFIFWGVLIGKKCLPLFDLALSEVRKKTNL